MRKGVNENSRRLSGEGVALGIGEKDLFTLRVMRLPSPNLRVVPSVSWQLDVDVKEGQEQRIRDSMSLSSDLIVASSIGSLYLGETFRACISISHHSLAAVPEAGIKIEVQTSNNRVTLVDSTAKQALFEFQAGEIKDYIVHHKLTEPGINFLVCCVMYNDEAGLRKSFQKFFKFQVDNPFSIRTQITPSQDIILLEALVKNMMNRPVVLENVSFIPSVSFTVQDLNHSLSASAAPPAAPSAALAPAAAAAAVAEMSASSLLARDRKIEETEQSLVVINVNETRAYLYKLVETPSIAKEVQDIGKLKLSWRSLLGETGTHAMPVFHPSLKLARARGGEFSLTLSKGPATVVLEKPFTLQLLVTNHSIAGIQKRDYRTTGPSKSKEPVLPRTLRLQLIREKMISILPYELSSRSVGVLGPGASKEITVQLLPVGLGMQKISGFRLSCVKTGKSIDIDSLHTVQVNTVLSSNNPSPGVLSLPVSPATPAAAPVHVASFAASSSAPAAAPSAAPPLPTAPRPSVPGGHSSDH